MDQFMQAVCPGEWIRDADGTGFTREESGFGQWDVRRADRVNVAVTLYGVHGGVFLVAQTPEDLGKAADKIRKIAAVLS